MSAIQSYIIKLETELAQLRARERKIIDQAWGEALEDGSVPSTKLQDKIIAAVDAHGQSGSTADPAHLPHGPSDD